jgi:hypothetical protein
MSNDQSLFEAGLRKVLSVSPGELKKRLAEDRASKAAKKLAKAQPKDPGKDLDRP